MPGATQEVHGQLEPINQETNENRRKFEDFCRSLGPEEFAAGVPQSTWTVKHYIAHLATIDIYVGDRLAHAAEGKSWQPKGEDGGPFNLDTWNEARIVERKSKTIEELLTEAAERREQLWATVDRFTPELLGQEFNFRDNPITYLGYFQLWARHDAAHTADMLRAIPRRKEEPALKQWLARYGF